MMEHFFHRLHQLLWDGCVEVAVSILKGPLVVAYHPLGADKPQPEGKPSHYIL